MQNLTRPIRLHRALLLLGTCVLAAWVPAAPVIAQNAGEKPSPFDALAGDWQGSGTLQGNAVDAEMSWEPVLAGRHVRLTTRFLVGGQVIFEGHAYYRPGEEIRGVWFDGAGHIYEITARAEGGELVSDWGDPAIERGRSIYTLTGADGLTVVDAVRGEDGELREFARVTYRRE
jgi:hypothetical protein